MISDGQGRSVPEWIGKTPDSMPPERVRLRIVRRYGGLCYLTGRPIAGKKWALDHVIALANGGENRESNLAPALQEGDAHTAKTARDVATKAKIDRVAKRHYGIRSAPRRKIESRGFEKSEKARKPKEPLPPSKLFR